METEVSHQGQLADRPSVGLELLGGLPRRHHERLRQVGGTPAAIPWGNALAFDILQALDGAVFSSIRQIVTCRSIDAAMRRMFFGGSLNSRIFSVVPWPRSPEILLTAFFLVSHIASSIVYP
jgi:hypothetical protein